MASVNNYKEVGSFASPNHPLECEGHVFFTSAETGVGTTNVPVEIFSDYRSTDDTTLHTSRQLRFRVGHLDKKVVSDSFYSVADCGVQYDGSCFFITRPQSTVSMGWYKDFLIDRDGNVGIGWSISPELDEFDNRLGRSLPLQFKLDVNGAGRFTGLQASSFTADTLKANVSLEALNSTFTGNITFSPFEGATDADMVELDLGDQRKWILPKRAFESITQTVGDTLNALDGIDSILTLGDTTTKDLTVGNLYATGGGNVYAKNNVTAKDDLLVGGRATIGLKLNDLDPRHVDVTANFAGPNPALKGLLTVAKNNEIASDMFHMAFVNETASGGLTAGSHVVSLADDGRLTFKPFNSLSTLSTSSVQFGAPDAVADDQRVLEHFDVYARNAAFYSTDVYDLDGGQRKKIIQLKSKYTGDNTVPNNVVIIRDRLGINKEPDFALDVKGATAFNYDLDQYIYTGRTAIGGSVHSDWAWFSHLDLAESATGYALIQDSAGTTHVNAPTGQTVSFRIQNLDQARIVDGGLRMPNGKSIVFDQTGAGIQQNYGTYGCVQTYGTGGGWSGFACSGGYQGASRHVFMSSGYATGIYGESAAEWFIYCRDNGGVDLRYNDGVKLETLADGVNIYGNHNTTGAIRQGGVDVINTSKQFVGTGGVDTTGAVTADQNITTPMDMSCRDLTATRNVKAVNAIGIVQNPFAKLTIGSTASGFGNIDEIAFRSVNNDANSRSGYVQRIGFYGKAQYSNDNSVTALISCLYGSNVHYPTYPGNSSTQLKFSTTDTYGGFDERMSINGFHITTSSDIPFIPGTFIGFVAFNDTSPSHNDFNIYNPIVMDRTMQNFNSMYNTSNGIFVVPYDGHYHVSFTVWNDDGFSGFGLLDSTNNGGTWSLHRMGTSVFSSSNSDGIQSTVSQGEAHTYAGIVFLRTSRHYSFGWVAGNNPRYTAESQTRCSVHLISSWKAALNNNPLP